MKPLSLIKNIISDVNRVWLNLKRPSKTGNMRRLENTGETPDGIIIREINSDDLTSLVNLHVKTWAETYRNVKIPPTFEIREYQWKEQFKVTDGSWFCFVAEDSKGNLVGFAKGRTYNHTDLPDFSGEVHKIYLLSNYQRLGIGRKLLCAVARKFLDKGINSMVLFGTASNPSGYFHQTLGAKKIYAANGEFHGGYGWYDLKELVTVCTGS